MDQVPQCSNCRMLETYKTINKELTQKYAEIKDQQSVTQKQIVELQLENMNLKRQNVVKVTEWSRLINQASQAFNDIQQVIGTTSARFSNFLNQNVIPMAGDISLQSDMNDTDMFTPRPTNSRTPTIKRVRPIIRTPNGLMQNVCISLPRVDQSLIINGDSSINSSLASISGNNMPINTNRLHVEWERRSMSPVSPVREEDQAAAWLPAANAPEGNGLESASESDFAGFEEAGTTTRQVARNNAINCHSRQSLDEEEYDGLSIIPEVTEVEYSVNQTQRAANIFNRHNNSSSESSSDLEEILTKQYRRKRSKTTYNNKENSLLDGNDSLTNNTSIQHASCSTPYHRTERRQTLKNAKVVIQPLSVEELNAVHENHRDESEESEESHDNRPSTSKNPQPRRYRAESEVSHSSVDSDGGSSTSRMSRPKRRVTPTSFKEPNLTKKLRRP